MIKDPYNLQRFLGAQESFYAQALKEIRNGCKTSHWIWFIFPQVYGLGHSPMSDNYGIRSLDETRAYLNNPVLKSRLIEISTALLQHSKGSLFSKPKTAEQILGYTDALKVRSCMTLFDLVEPDAIFAQVLDAFYNGERDDLTLQILKLIQKLKR
jgi:uncharacterized protein (DUF1810 family)